MAAVSSSTKLFLDGAPQKLWNAFFLSRMTHRGFLGGYLIFDLGGILLKSFQKVDSVKSSQIAGGH